MKPRIITPSATAATVTAATPADGSDKQIEDSSNEELLNSGELVLEEQVIRWERFLPRRFLRVLLVENDDSTRQIVSALLRKCNYQVAAVADGLKAWAVLKKRHYKFDLVLTEVVVPPFSGISLLSKIMSNEICKTIPVIMMSSHDSMGIVFKCMLKGASDFLVKPVRKNELRNLWQHVWRKYCVCFPPQPSSGSCGDELPSKTKVDTGSVNGLANNRGSANCGSRSKTGNNSDQGSRSQSSCRKSEAEIQSRQKLEEPLETVNRIFTEETSSEPGKHDCDVAMLATISSPIHEKGKVEDKSMEKETKVTLPVHEVVSTEKGWGKTCTYDRSLYREENSASIRGKYFSNIDNSYLLDGKDGANNVVKEIIKLIGEESSTQCSHGALEDHTQQENIFYSLAKTPDKRATTFTSGFSPSCQLNKENEVFEAKHILNHSGSSAFSRYINGRSHLLGPETGSSSAWICSKTNECDELNQSINASSDNEKRIPFPLIEISTSSRRCETLTDNQLPVNCGNEEADPSPSLPSRTRNSVDIPSGKDISSNPHFGVIPYSIPIGSIPFQSTFAGFGTIVQPFCYPTNSMPTLGYSEGQKATYIVPPNISAQNNTLHRSPHHFMKNNHSPQIMHGVEAQRADSVPLYPRILLNPPVEILNLVKNSNFASTIASGSNGGYKEITNNETALASKNEDGSLNSNGAAFDCDRSRRETALNRFRLKRKERCFEKKVRYHNRKNLAEQRPRMKGQFVRQAVESQPE